MTLNITLISPEAIYQSSDFRLTDLKTGKPWDNIAQKGVILDRYPGHTSWSAVIAFAGVGNTGHPDYLDVAEWLGKLVAGIAWDARFDDLISSLLDANIWLSRMPRRALHTLTVAAFVGGRPRIVLLSTYESLHTRSLRSPKQKLEMSKLNILRPAIFVTGIPSAVVAADRQRLLQFLMEKRPAAEIEEALAAVNRRAADASTRISPACFTSWINNIGEGASRPHGLNDRQDYMPDFVTEQFRRLGFELLRKDSRTPIRFVGMTQVAEEPNDEFYQRKLKVKPDDPNVHNSYGAYLLDAKGDVDGAELAFLKAISLNQGHALALSNYGGLLWLRRGKVSLAGDYLRRGFEADRSIALNRLKLAEYLEQAIADPAAAEELYKEGLSANPSQANFLLGYARFLRRRRRYGEAAEFFGTYLSHRPDDSEALSSRAECLALSGGSPGES